MVGKFMNQHGWTDVEPFEVVKVVSDKCVEVRAMKAELDPSWKPAFVPGGFSAVCVNGGSQRWNIQSDESAEVIRVRQHKNGTWKNKYGALFRPSDSPRKFYDYNF